MKNLIETIEFNRVYEELNLRFLVDEEKLTALCFGKSKKKPKWNCKFKTIESLEEYVKDEIETAQYYFKLNNKYKEEAKAKTIWARENVKVGDIFVSQWGYEQSNVDFFQVVARPSKAKVTVRPIRSKNVLYITSDSGRVAPLKDDFIGDEESTYNLGAKSFKINSYAHATLAVEGETYYTSSYA